MYISGYGLGYGNVVTSREFVPGYGYVDFDANGNPISLLSTPTQGVSPNSSDWLPNFTNPSGRGIAGSNMASFTTGGGGDGGFGTNTTGSLPIGLPSGRNESFLDQFRRLIGLRPSTSIATPPFNGNPDTGQLPDGTVVPGNTGTPKGQGTNVKSILDLVSGLMGIAQAGLPIYGAINADQQQNWLNSAKINVLNYLREQGALSQDQVKQIQESYLPQMTAASNNLLGASQGLQGLQGANLQQLMGQAGGDFATKNPYSTIPGLEGVINYLGSLQGFGNTALGGLQGSLGQLQPGLSAANSLGEGNNPLLGAMNQAGMGLYSNQGMNPTTAAAQNAGIQALRNFGQTPQLQQIQQLASQMFNNPGGGYGVQRGQQILSQNPLLPMDQVLSMAQNQSATGAKNQYNNLKRQLLNTTGITGPMIAGGGVNELLSQLGDQSLQNQSKAMTDALMGQQALQSNLFGQAAGLYNSGAGLGQAGQSNALQALLSGSGQALQNQTGLGQLALGGGNLDLSRILGGTSTLNSSLNNQLGGLGALGSLYGQQTGGYNAITNLLSTLAANSMGQGNLFSGAQGMGQNQTKNYYDAMSNLLGQQGNLAGQMQTGGLGAGQFPANAFQQYLQNLGSNTTSQVGLFGQAPPQNFFTGLKT